MGSRDKSHREAKKPKKDSAKKALPSVSPLFVPPPPVEVIKKGKKEKFE